MGEAAATARARTSGTMSKLWPFSSPTWRARCDRTLCAVEFLHATDERGLMSFRVHLPLERAQEFGRAAADGRMGCLVKACWEWQLCGDDDWLRALWPKVRKALEFCWIPGAWNADQDGVMEGCQQNTTDAAEIRQHSRIAELNCFGQPMGSPESPVALFGSVGG